MGICEASNNNNKFDNVPSISHKQLNQIPENYSYKFDSDKIQNSLKKAFNLKFTFSNFKIKYCVSHKPDRNSFYITEIRLGEKAFPLVINSGPSPNIPNLKDDGYFIEKEFKLNELENTYMFINIYEYTEDMPSLNMSLKEIPNELKTRSKYNSYFRINLSSFLFKSSNCDFPLMGNNQLSTNTRIAFNCHIEQKEKIKIIAQCKNAMNPYIKRLVFEYKDEIISSDARQSNGCFSITTSPMTMSDFQNSNIYLERNEDENYSYISLNNLKHNLLVNLGKKVIKYTDMDNINYHKPFDMNESTNSLKNSSILDIFKPKYPEINQNDYHYMYNNPKNDFYYGNNMFGVGGSQSQSQAQTIFQEYEKEENNDAVLFISNLPVFTQINNLYFTEYGNVYNTSILNIINKDPDLHNFRKSKQISSDDFKEKLTKYYQEFNTPNFKISVLNDIQILLMRSIDTDRFMFIYPTEESLVGMIFLLMNLGITIINYLLKSKDEYEIIQLLKIINTLVKREELDNSLLYFTLKKSSYGFIDNTSKQLFNQFYLSLYELYLYLISNRAPQNNDDILIELFSRLYFKKKYFRKIMLETLRVIKTDSNKQNIVGEDFDIFLYDRMNDEKLNKYLNSETLSYFEHFSSVNANLLNNLKYDKYKLFKRIIATIKDFNMYQYPFEYSMFHDIDYIIEQIQKEIELQKYEKNNRPPLTNDFYEMLMLFSNSYYSITNINNTLISSTNIHNQYAIYTLYIYFKSLFEYHYSLTNSKLIFDYNLFEQASDILIKDEDSVSLPRLFWFYYSCNNLLLTGNLKWFIIHIVNKNFDKLAYHWSFTIRQVYFKFLIYVINDKLKDKEGRLFNQQKLNPFKSRSLGNYNKTPYLTEAMKDYDIISKEYNIWAARKSMNADLPVFTLPPPINIYGGLD